MRARIVSAAPAILAGGSVTLVLLGITVVTDAVDPFDAALIGLVRSPELLVPLAPLRPATELGSTGAITAVAVLAVVLGLILRRPWLGLGGALTIAAAALANSALKVAIARERPDLLEPLIEERGFSFPSGHAALSAVAYGVLAVLLARSPLPGRLRLAAGALLAIVVFLVGTSRVYLGVHFPSDVLAGWLAGLLVVLAYALLSRAAQRVRDAAAAPADRGAPRSGPPGPG